jgi:hypothetical protein
MSKPSKYGYLRNNGALAYVDQTMNGILITESGMLAAAHLVGHNGVLKALQSGDLTSQKDGLGTTAFEYMSLLGGYDISAIK